MSARSVAGNPPCRPASCRRPLSPRPIAACEHVAAEPISLEIQPERIDRDRAGEDVKPDLHVESPDDAGHDERAIKWIGMCPFTPTAECCRY